MAGLRDLMLFAPGVDALHDQFVYRMKVPASDFFLHQLLGFRFELPCHTSNLAGSVPRRKLCGFLGLQRGHLA